MAKNAKMTMTLQEAAELSGKNKNWWYYRTRTHQIEHQRMGIYIVISEDEFNRVLKANKIEISGVPQVEKSGTYIIEKNIPLPPRSNDMKYPVDKMEIGDSFLIPVQPNTRRKRRQAAASALNRGRQKFQGKRKFTSRTQAEGVRIWRVE